MAGVVVLALLAGAAWFFLLRDAGSDTLADVGAGDCLVSSAIGEGKGTVDDLEIVECGDGHDAEVFAAVELDKSQAEDYDDTIGGELCSAQADDKGTSVADLDSEDLEVRPLVPDSPSEGDDLLCLVRHKSGDELKGSAF